MTVDTLLKSLTIDQKLAQLTAEGSPGCFVKDGKFNADYARRQHPHGIGGMMVPIDLTPEEIGEWVCQMRKCFAELSPVPPILMCESLHGILGKGSTVFPQSIGMGASFDPELMQKVGEAIGREAKALGIRMSLAPDLDLGRDPRWGRIEETYGESSYLTGEMGKAYITGLLADDGKYTSVIKHFAAHGSPEAGVNLAPVNVTLQELEDKYLPPFKKALDAGAKGVMPAYSALNGVPCHTNTLLMNEILRERWGFDGIVLSDFGAMNMLSSFQCSTEDNVEAGLLSMEHGMDLQVPPILPAEKWKELIAEDRISMDTIDNAVRRIIKMKMESGVFDLPEPSAETIRQTVRCDAHKGLAREAARKSIVLMKNEGVLPLRAGQKIAVVGPNASSTQLGDYALPRFDTKTPVEALTERAEKAGGSVVFAKGCDVYGSDTSGFAEAETAAADADAVVCIIGGKSMKGYGVGWGSEEESILTCGEGCDMHDLIPGGPQLDLVRTMIATGKPVVIVMIDGRPETLFDAADNCGALVAAWYPGEEGSSALAELLYGDCNFSAKLPVTFPRHVGQLPLYHDRVPSACGFYKSPGTPDRPGRDYVFGDTHEAYPFGHGLGYSEIEYTSVTAERTGDGLRVCVEIANKGSYDADEPVLVFLRDETASLPQPVRKLAALGKIHLPAGTTKQMELTIPEEQLMFTDAKMQKRLEAGWFTVMAGVCSTRVYCG
ncbi:MAG: glycoside hydrolase family 3 C-terminal domain-containing protein [Clostridia bacterium]|nr:glycoside hydrolase family 3 C-terminal domain-containing protein [Clostridia bacterium]